MFDMEEFLARVRKGGDDAINAVREYLAELVIEVHSISDAQASPPNATAPAGKDNGQGGAGSAKG